MDVSPPAVEAVSVDKFAEISDLGRSFVYRALHPDPAYRRGLPFLPSVKVGKRRLIRLEAGRQWLTALETKSAA